jgi:hypothetical protein
MTTRCHLNASLPTGLDTGKDRSLIRAAIEKQLSHGTYVPGHLHGDGLAGRRVAQAIAEIPLTVVKRLDYQRSG